MPTLNTVFKQIFAEALEPLGFKKIKGKYPYFVRLIGDEILHIITYRTEPMRRPGYKEFSILGGVATVYRQRISLDLPPRDNVNWLRDNSEIYTRLNPLNFDAEFRRNIYSFSYKEETLVEAVEHSLKITEQIMFPILDVVTDLNACIEFFHKFRLPTIVYDDSEDFGKKYGNGLYNEGLLYIKTGNYNVFTKHMEKAIANSQQFSESVQKDVAEFWLKQKFSLDKINADSELNLKVFKELERRKVANTEILKSYGLINSKNTEKKGTQNNEKND